MKLARGLAGFLLWGAALCAYAHAHLEQATPADGSVLSAPPAQLVLRFSEAARLTAFSIQGASTRQNVTALPEQPQTTIVVPLPPLAPGHYVLSFRVVGADGHVVPGQVRFTLSR